MAESIHRQLFRLAWPIIGLNVLQVMMLGVDSALCGRMANPQPVLAALGYSIQVVFLLMVAMLGLTVGTVALVARAYGGGDTQRLNHLLVQATQLTVVVGIVVGIAGALGAEHILLALDASPEVAKIGADYLRPLMAGTPFFYLTLLYAGILRGVGNTRIPFLVALGTNVINAVLNYGLILGNLGMPALGVTGSAIGTVVAQASGVVALVMVLRSGKVPNLKLPLHLRAVDHQLAVELFRVGWPAAIDLLVLNVGFLTALAMLGRIDQVSVAAHGLGLRVQSFAFVPGIGIAQATGAMVGQALGGSNVPRAKAVARASILLCLAIMTALAIAIFATGPLLVQVFDVMPDTKLGDYTIVWLQILAVAMPPAAINMALIGLLQGAGATRTSLRINIWATIAIQVPVALVLGFGFDLGEIGVWWSFPIGFAAKAVLNYVELKRERWAVTGVRMSKKV
ncbi:MAG TPA: MATE family efflux transporter [Kofleriaceae bacterium]|nr:MATE family efflux transporter [Kofleriaceae bacterium]